MAFVKDPSAVLDYPIDWTLWLQGGAGETTISNEVNGVTIGSTGSAVLTWNPTSAPTKIYRGTTPGGEDATIDAHVGTWTK